MTVLIVFHKKYILSKGCKDEKGNPNDVCFPLLTRIHKYQKRIEKLKQAQIRQLSETLLSQMCAITSYPNPSLDISRQI